LSSFFSVARSAGSQSAWTPVIVLGGDPAAGSICANALNAALLQTEYLTSLEAYLERATPQVLILDIAPGSLDVCSVIQFIRRIEPAPALILLSAHGPSILRSFAANAKSIGLEILGTLNKPVELDTLFALVQGRLRAFDTLAPAAVVAKIQPTPLPSSEALDLFDAGALEAYLQPKFRLSDLSISGFETLARMNHPQLGVLAPGRFLAPLLENGAGPALTLQMLIGAARSRARLARYQGDRAWQYAVNVTADLPVQDNPDWLKLQVESLGMDPANLMIEIPEATLSEDLLIWHRVLTQARLMGIGVSLDDFGCQAANLERLLLLPLTEVKVDRMFLEHAMNDRDARRLLGSINRMIKDLGMLSVVEGVSSADMLSLAIDAGFDYAQGFHLGLPLTLAETEAFVIARDETV